MQPEKVSEIELKKIFKTSSDRSSFILDYSHFGKDNNDDFYKAFIDANIFSGKKHKLQENAIELSLSAGIFNISYLDVISKIIHSKRPSGIKLLCLDWLNYFVNDIPESKYYELNLITKTSDDEFLKLQSILNLLFVKTDENLLNEATELLKNTVTPTLYYRFINHLNDNELLKTHYPNILNTYQNLVAHHIILSDAQRSELIRKLSGQ